MFSSYTLTTSNGKHLVDFSQALIVSIMYKLKISVKNTDDLSMGLDSDRIRRQRESTNNRNQKAKKHVRVMLRDMSGFA